MLKDIPAWGRVIEDALDPAARDSRRRRPRFPPPSEEDS